jgi:hypothetical protein
MNECLRGPDGPFTRLPRAAGLFIPMGLSAGFNDACSMAASPVRVRHFDAHAAHDWIRLGGDRARERPPIGLLQGMTVRQGEGSRSHARHPPIQS